MDRDVTYDCPYCGSSSYSEFDEGDGLKEFTVDCSVCCKPVALRVRVKGGEVVEVRHEAEA